MFSELKKNVLRDGVIDPVAGVVDSVALCGAARLLLEAPVTPLISCASDRVGFNEFGSDRAVGSYSSLDQGCSAGVTGVDGGFFISTLTDPLFPAAVFIMIRLINRLREQAAQDPRSAVITGSCSGCLSEVSRMAGRHPFCTAFLQPTVSEEEVKE